MKNRDVIIVVCSISTAVVCVGLTWLGNYKYGGALSPDAFYGVLATFIGICATLLVGLQIVNSLKIQETERQIKEVQTERNHMRVELEELKNETAYIQIELANTLTVIAGSNESPYVKASCNIMAIVLCDKELTDKDVLLKRYKNLAEAINKSSKEELKHLSRQVPKLKEMQIPTDIEYYTEIMSLHIKVIGILENANN